MDIVDGHKEKIIYQFDMPFSEPAESPIEAVTAGITPKIRHESGIIKSIFVQVVERAFGLSAI